MSRAAPLPAVSVEVGLSKPLCLVTGILTAVSIAALACIFIEQGCEFTSLISSDARPVLYFGSVTFVIFALSGIACICRHLDAKRAVAAAQGIEPEIVVQVPPVRVDIQPPAPQPAVSEAVVQLPRDKPVATQSDPVPVQPPVVASAPPPLEREPPAQVDAPPPARVDVQTPAPVQPAPPAQPAVPEVVVQVARVEEDARQPAPAPVPEPVVVTAQPVVVDGVTPPPVVDAAPPSLPAPGPAVAPPIVDGAPLPTTVSAPDAVPPLPPPSFSGTPAPVRNYSVLSSVPRPDAVAPDAVPPLPPPSFSGTPAPVRNYSVLSSVPRPDAVLPPERYESKREEAPLTTEFAQEWAKEWEGSTVGLAREVVEGYQKFLLQFAEIKLERIPEKHWNAPIPFPKELFLPLLISLANAGEKELFEKLYRQWKLSGEEPVVYLPIPKNLGKRLHRLFGYVAEEFILRVREKETIDIAFLQICKIARMLPVLLYRDLSEEEMRALNHVFYTEVDDNGENTAFHQFAYLEKEAAKIYGERLKEVVQQEYTRNLLQHLDIYFRTGEKHDLAQLPNFKTLAKKYSALEKALIQSKFPEKDIQKLIKKRIQIHFRSKPDEATGLTLGVELQDVSGVGNLKEQAALVLEDILSEKYGNPEAVAKELETFGQTGKVGAQLGKMSSFSKLYKKLKVVLDLFQSEKDREVFLRRFFAKSNKTINRYGFDRVAHRETAEELSKIDKSYTMKHFDSIVSLGEKLSKKETLLTDLQSYGLSGATTSNLLAEPLFTKIVKEIDKVPEKFREGVRQVLFRRSARDQPHFEFTSYTWIAVTAKELTPLHKAYCDIVNAVKTDRSQISTHLSLEVSKTIKTDHKVYQLCRIRCPWLLFNAAGYLKIPTMNGWINQSVRSTFASWDIIKIGTWFGGFAGEDIARYLNIGYELVADTELRLGIGAAMAKSYTSQVKAFKALPEDNLLSFLLGLIPFYEKYLADPNALVAQKLDAKKPSKKEPAKPLTYLPPPQPEAVGLTSPLAECFRLLVNHVLAPVQLVEEGIVEDVQFIQMLPKVAGLVKSAGQPLKFPRKFLPRLLIILDNLGEKKLGAAIRAQSKEAAGEVVQLAIPQGNYCEKIQQILMGYLIPKFAEFFDKPVKDVEHLQREAFVTLHTTTLLLLLPDIKKIPDIEKFLRVEFEQNKNKHESRHAVPLVAGDRVIEMEAGFGNPAARMLPEGEGVFAKACQLVNEMRSCALDDHVEDVRRALFGLWECTEKEEFIFTFAIEGYFYPKDWPRVERLLEEFLKLKGAKDSIIQELLEANKSTDGLYLMVPTRIPSRSLLDCEEGVTLEAREKELSEKELSEEEELSSMLQKAFVSLAREEGSKRGEYRKLWAAHVGKLTEDIRKLDIHNPDKFALGLMHVINDFFKAMAH